jgi:hypothetical protein
MTIIQPTIIYGTAWKKSDTEGLVQIALKQGFRAIDTACQPKHYDEAGVGAGIAASLDGNLSRADLYLQTKFTSLTGQDPNLVPYDPRVPLADQVTQSLAASLRNLRTSYIDCLILHAPLENAQQTLVAWRAMESLVAAVPSVSSALAIATTSSSWTSFIRRLPLSPPSCKIGSTRPPAMTVSCARIAFNGTSAIRAFGRSLPTHKFLPIPRWRLWRRNTSERRNRCCSATSRKSASSL